MKQQKRWQDAPASPTYSKDVPAVPYSSPAPPYSPAPDYSSLPGMVSSHATKPSGSGVTPLLGVRFKSPIFPGANSGILRVAEPQTLADFKNRCGELKTTIKRMEADASTIAGEKKDLEARAIQLESQVENADAATAKIVGELTRKHEEEKQNLEKQLEELKTSLTARITDANQEVEKLAGLLAKRSSETKTLYAKVQEMEDSHAAQLKRAAKREKTLKKELQKERQARINLEERVAELEDEVEWLNGELDHKNDELKKAMDRRSTLEKKLVELHSYATEEVLKLQDALQESQQQLVDAINENAVLKKKVAMARVSLDVAVSNYQKMVMC